MQRNRLMNKQPELITAALLMLCALIIVMFFFRPSESEETDSYPLAPEDSLSTEPVLFSLEDFFYEETVTLALHPGAEDIVSLLYTLDSTPPDGGNGITYQTPIPLSCPEDGSTGTFVVKACGQRADGSFTEVYTHSYFVGKDIRSRFDTLVFSLSTDPYHLYDYDHGILVPGRMRDDYVAETGKEPDEGSPANYFLDGIESERPVYVEVIDENGDRLIAQNAGIRVFGGYSRRFSQKSFRLYARSEYDPVLNTFDFDFFPDDSTQYGLSKTNYKRLVLRNSGNDRAAGYFRDELIQNAARETGLKDTQYSRPAAIFLNGAYYGFVWLKSVYQERELDDRSHIEDASWVILDANGETALPVNEDSDESEAAAINDYNAMYAYSAKDLTDDQTFQEFSAIVDVENFLTYYAIQIYTGNFDWPGGNKRVYRYYGPAPTEPSSADSAAGTEHPASPTVTAAGILNNQTAATDGRWRWLLYDTDCGLNPNGVYGASSNTLGVLLGQAAEEDYFLGLRPSPLLMSVLQREDMKEKFVRILCDLMNGPFSETNLAIGIDELDRIRYNELEHQFQINGGGSWEEIALQTDYILTFARERPAAMKQQIETCLGFIPEGYTITCAFNENADIQINSIKLKNDFRGFYYQRNRVTVTATPPPGNSIAYWLVNGSPVYETILELNQTHATDGRIHVEPVIASDEHPVPILSAVSYESNRDYVMICNPYETNLDLSHYYISDDLEEPYKQILADCILRPGETLKLFCDNYMELDALGGFHIGFNLKNEETLIISDREGLTVQAAYLPDIKNDHILVRNMETGTFEDLIGSTAD